MIKLLAVDASYSKLKHVLYLGWTWASDEKATKLSKVPQKDVDNCMICETVVKPIEFWKILMNL